MLKFKVIASAIAVRALTGFASPAQAAGAQGLGTSPFVTITSTAGAPDMSAAFPSVLDIRSHVLGECGRGRVRDSQTGSCHGPGDLGP